MVFSSLAFLYFFLPLCVLVYYTVPRGLKNVVLCFFSLVFYAWGEPVYIVLILFSAAVDYFNGRAIERFSDNSRCKKFFLYLSIIVNLSLLGFFKYSGFIINNINALGFISLKSINIALPIGISFYTFQTMSYSMDVYRGDVKAERNFLDFLCFVSMFPQLIAGPIVRYSQISRELKQRTLDFKNFETGLLRFTRGLSKKVLLANNIGLLYDSLIGEQLNVPFAAWLAVFSYGMQIYFDFSGYSDMAVGLGKMFGFTYGENFNYPYTAVSITDFWRRWHISLSGFFRDYVYIPLGGSREGEAKTVRNLIIVWMLTGLWHGASWNFVLWGAYFGVVLIIEKYFLKGFIEKWPSFLRHAYTLVIVFCGWAIFAQADIQPGGSLLAVELFSFAGRAFLNARCLYLLRNYGFIIIMCILFSTQLPKKVSETIFRGMPGNVLRVIFYLSVFILSTACIVENSFNPFLYFRF